MFPFLEFFESYHVWNFYNGQAYNCPRGWRLSASGDPTESPLKPFELDGQYGTEGLKGGPNLGPHYAYRSASAYD